ncbi:hypothetical protein C1645_743206 [Glomus cerebriforme]|uniref:Uncharacterized protein n=1 Tax=Glomus cerebriforme TaxID=658196 RepID=A0A397SKC7_9GLOM|nr:hypothetical protein C1645_743206 [Glomus cerebriforme]
MKLNLPSNLNSKKIQTLLFLTLFNSSPVETGSQFSKCLSKGPSYGNVNILNNLYNTIKSFVNNRADKEWFCCGAQHQECSPMLDNNCPYIGFGYNLGQCVSIEQSKFCVLGGTEWHITAAGLCGGVLGEEPITANFTEGICPNYDLIASALQGPKTAPTFSWICCNNDSCNVPTNVDFSRSLNSILETNNCPTESYFLACFYDNGG